MTKSSRKSRIVSVRGRHVTDALAKADWKKIDGLRDRDIARALRNDPDNAELSRRGPVEVVLPDAIDVADIRHRLHLSQAGFARRIGVSTRLVSDWEQGRQRPAAAARALLLILDELGEVALRALARGAA
jgi:DNA-binding transcriptional regulator YiaG